MGFLAFGLPGGSWLTVSCSLRRDKVEVLLSSSRNTAGEYSMNLIAEDWERVKGELGGTARKIEFEGRPRIIDSMAAKPLSREDVRKKAFAWLADRVNTFVNVMRPRVRSAVADYQLVGR